MSQIELLLTDLGTIDTFFQRHGYHAWTGMESEREKLELALQAGWNALERLRGPLSPLLDYNSILSYGEKPGPEQGGKRFFVDVSVWGMANCFSYQYQIRVRPFPGNSGSEIEVVERYFSIPMESRAENPLGKMLAVLEERENLPSSDSTGA